MAQYSSTRFAPILSYITALYRYIYSIFQQPTLSILNLGTEQYTSISVCTVLYIHIYARCCLYTSTYLLEALFVYIYIQYI